MVQTRARDIVLAVLIVGIISLGLFNMVGGFREAYNVTDDETFDEDTLQANDDVIDTVNNLREELSDADNILSAAYVLIFTGFKTVILALIAIFASIQTLIGGLMTYLGLAEYIAYIILIVLVVVIFTIWRALQGREGV